MSYVDVDVLMAMDAYGCDWVCHKLYVVKYTYVRGYYCICCGYMDGHKFGHIGVHVYTRYVCEYSHYLKNIDL